jgi:adenylate cyclase class IV
MLVGKTRVHIDRVEGLGCFLELEVVLEETDTLAAGEAAATAILRLLDVPSGDLISGAYIDLLDAQHAPTSATRRS